MQQGLVEFTINLGAKATDLAVHHIGLRVKMHVPYLFKQHGAGQYATRPAHEVFQQA